MASQGDDLSERSTPRSRASCSRVMGMKDPAQRKRVQFSIVGKQSNVFYTNTANHKDFGRPSITIPARQLFIACQSRILAGILWLTSMSVWVEVRIHESMIG